MGATQPRMRLGSSGSTQRPTCATLEAPRACLPFEPVGRRRALCGTVGGRPRRRHGINSAPLGRGRFKCRYDVLDNRRSDSSTLWDDVSASAAQFTLIRGGEAAFVSTEEAIEFVHRSPATVVRTVPGAGHSVQSDRPPSSP